MLSAFGGLFKKQKKDDPNIIRFLRGEECIGFWDKKAHELHFNDEVVDGDASVWVFASQHDCFVDDQNYLCRLINDVLVRVGYISTSGEVMSITQNKAVGLVVPFSFSEKEDFLEGTILHAAILVYKDELPIPEENEYTRRVEAMRKNGALYQANLTKTDLWLKTSKEKMVIYKTSRVGHETLLGRMIACLDGGKIQLKEDTTYKGLGKITVALRERGDPQTIELDEKVELVEMDALGGLTIVRLGQLFSFLTTKSLKYNFYDMKGDITGYIDIEDKHMPYYPIKYIFVQPKYGSSKDLGYEKGAKYKGDSFGRGESDGSILKKMGNGAMTKVGAIDANGVIHQFHDHFSDEIIGKVEPLPKSDHMANLAYAALELFFPFI